MNQKRPIHLTDMQRALDHSRIDREPVDIDCWATDGRILQYRQWLVTSNSWRQGTHRLHNPRSGEVRQVRDIMIFRFNGYNVYL